jgi:hypothetical protein
MCWFCASRIKSCFDVSLLEHRRMSTRGGRCCEVSRGSASSVQEHAYPVHMRDISDLKPGQWAFACRLLLPSNSKQQKAWWTCDATARCIVVSIYCRIVRHKVLSVVLVPAASVRIYDIWMRKQFGTQFNVFTALGITDSAVERIVSN